MSTKTEFVIERGGERSPRHRSVSSGRVLSGFRRQHQLERIASLARAPVRRLSYDVRATRPERWHP